MKKVLVKINEIYEEVRQQKKTPIFKTIKPFVDEVHQLTDEWNEFAKNGYKRIRLKIFLLNKLMRQVKI